MYTRIRNIIFSNVQDMIVLRIDENYNSWSGYFRGLTIEYTFLRSKLALKLRTIEPHVHIYWFIYNKACTSLVMDNEN